MDHNNGASSIHENSAVIDPNDGASSVHDNFQDILSASRNKRRVDNPFRHWNTDEIEAIVQAFVRRYNLTDEEDRFLQAGRILHRPEEWTAFEDELPPDACAALRREKGSFFTQVAPFKRTIVTLCVAAIVQGWTQTISNGANLSWPAAFDLDSIDTCNPTTHDVWIFALVNAVPWFTASFVGTWCSDPMSEYLLGRRAPILISALVIFASALGSAYSQSWRQLLACRALLGLGMGCKATVVPVFAAEVSPSHIRGSLVMNWQVFDAVGIFLGFSANLIASQVAHSWRWQMASLCLPNIVLITLIYTCPDSPRYQMKRSAQRQEQRLRRIWEAIGTWFQDVFRACFCMLEDDRSTSGSSTTTNDTANRIEQDYRKAFDTLIALRGHPIVAAKELLHIHFQMVVEVETILPGRRSDPRDPTGDRAQRFASEWLASPTSHPLGYLTKLGHLFSIPRIRRALGTAVVCMLSQQLCGVNVLAFYSSTLFKSTSCFGKGANSDLPRAGNTTPLWLSWGIGLENALFAIPAFWLIESAERSWFGSKRWLGGRRWLLLFTTPGMALSMLAATLSYFISENDAGYIPTIAFFIYVFLAFYSFGMGPVPFTMSSEVFPMEHRMVGMSVAVFVNFFGAGVLTLFVPVIANSEFNNNGLLGIFTILNVLAFLLIFLFVRETAGAAVGSQARSMIALSLEDLTVIFNVKTLGEKGFIHYQRWEVLPWAKKYVCWKMQRRWQTFRGVDKERRAARPDRPNNLIVWAQDLELQTQPRRNTTDGANEPQQTDEEMPSMQ